LRPDAQHNPSKSKSINDSRLKVEAIVIDLTLSLDEEDQEVIKASVKAGKQKAQDASTSSPPTNKRLAVSFKRSAG